MNKRQAGRLGGLATVRRYGHDHMAAIGQRGAQVFHTKYQLSPIGIGDFAIIHRETGEPLPKTLNGLELTEYNSDHPQP